MTWQETLETVFDYVEGKLKTITGMHVYRGQPPQVLNFPAAILGPGPSRFRAIDSSAYRVDVGFTVSIIVRDLSPDDWLDDVCGIMSNCMDAILEDKTLNGVAQDISEVDYIPAEIRFQNKMFYGGLLRFNCWLRYEV